MLSSIRKFSTSIYAKILLGIVIIPFVFWGMGSSITGGNKNIVVVIDKEKHSIQDFVNFIQNFAKPDEKISNNQIEELLSIFISEKLIEKEIEYFDIKLSDNSLSDLIKHQKEFKRNNKFSRVEYEKFLLERNISAVYFEANLSKNERKRQFLDFVSGGILPSKFLINATYDKINQKRNIELINLNDFFNKEINFSEKQIKLYYENNKKNYTEIYKSIKMIELNPKNLINDNEFNDLFFKRIDEIDDLIIQGETLDFIIQKFNLESANTFTLNKMGEDINSKKITVLSENIIKNVFSIPDSESTALLQSKDKYFIIEIIKSEDVEKGIDDNGVKKEVIANLSTGVKRRLISEIINKINQNNFTKLDFDKFSNEKNVPVKKIKLENQNDENKLEKKLINEIYAAPEKGIIIVTDLDFADNFLIYIDKVENVTIKESSKEHKKYLDLSKKEITTDLLNTYDEYIKKKYEIDINYKALEVVKNYFNQ